MSDDLVTRLLAFASPAAEVLDDGYRLTKMCHQSHEAAARIKELEAKLAKAVEALGTAAEWLDDYSAFTGNTYETTKSKTVRVAIAKIKGEQL
jgi:hypothetical protein